MKHTPGPWQMRISPGGEMASIWADSGEDGELVAIAEAPVCERNANLIAAAPDLLRELSDVLCFLKCAVESNHLDAEYAKAFIKEIEELFNHIEGEDAD